MYDIALYIHVQLVSHACVQAGILRKGRIQKVKCLMIVWLAIKSVAKSINRACRQKVFFFGGVWFI